LLRNIQQTFNESLLTITEEPEWNGYTIRKWLLFWSCHKN